MEEIKVEDDTKEENIEENDSKKISEDIENEEKVNEVNEIPTSIFNFDDTIGYDDEIEDDE